MKALMKKILLAALVLVGLSLSAQNASAQAVQISAQMTASAATTGTGIATPTTYYHQVSWTVTGSVATCSLTIDSSSDNSSWSSGGAIPAQTCTGGGVSGLINAAVGYIRINLGTFTCTAGTVCSIRISYIGYSAGISGAVLSGTGVPSGACTSGSLYTVIGTGALYSCDAGSWALVSGGGGSGTVTSIATTGPITGGTITTTGTIGCATCTTAAVALTTGQVVLGAGSQTEAVLAAPTPPTGVSDYVINDGTNPTTYAVPGVPIDARTTTTETITSSDRGGIVTFSNTSATALTLPAPTSNFGNNFNFGGCNINTGLVTMTPTASTFNGAATGLVPNHWCTYPYSDNSNYRGGTFPSIEAFLDCHSPGNAMGFTLATGLFSCFTGYASLAAPVFSTSISTPVVLTATKCAAVGSAASPSLVACSAAPAGSFSCATNASTATCVISSTIVTANSAVFVQPSAAAGTLLSVTCNTTADTGLTAPRLASISAGASFTINLGTFSTNPVCFNYWIVN